MTNSSPQNPTAKPPRALFAFLAAAVPHFHPNSMLGRAQARSAAFVASTPGTALIGLAATLAVLVGLSSGILAVARGAGSFIVLLGLIYALLIVAAGIVVVFLMFAMTLTHLVLGDEVLLRMRAASQAAEPDVEWARL